MYRISAVLLILLVAQGAPAAELTVRPALTFSLPFGGHNADTGTSVAVDSSGNAYVTGTTTSTDFPVKNGFQQQLLSAPAHSSSDQGKTWLTPAIPAPLYAVAASPKAPLVLFAGTSQGMYKSSDGGNTWITLANFDSTLLVQAVVADATNPSIVYAGSSGGTFKSTDAGMSWKLVDSGQYVSILVANPVLPTILFSVTFNESGNMYRSTDSGITWSLLPNAPAPFAVACDAVNPDVLYAAAFDQTGAAAVYQTSDGGNTWTQLAVLPVADSTFALAASPTTIYAATDNGVMISRDAGVTWTATSITAAADNVAVDPNHPNVAYSNAGGIFMTADSGTTWAEVLQIRMNVQTIAVVSTLSIVFVGASPGQGAFVTKWSADGSHIIYSTYLAGSYNDFPTAIAVDAQGNAYVTGYTYSNDFPVTASAIQSTTSATISAFVAKISPDGSKLLYSTYLNGSNLDGANAIAVDNTGNAYVTGSTTSPDFPVTTNASQPNLSEGCTLPPPDGFYVRENMGDGFVAKIDTVAGALRYSTFLGGSCADEGLGIAVDSSGNAYVTGATTSPDFPITPGALNSKFGGGGNMGFLTKYTLQGSLQYSTFVGGTGNESATGIALDASGNILITGSTFGFDQVLFPLTPGDGALVPNLTPPPSPPGFNVVSGGAAYVLKVDGSAMSRTFVTYLGGESGFGNAIGVNGSGKVWVTGSTNAPVSQPAQGFPLVHPFQADSGAGFVSEISADGSTLLFSSLVDLATGMALDSSGNAFVVGTTYVPKSVSGAIINYNSSPLLLRIDGAVPSAVTIEAPQRLVPLTPGFYAFPGVAPGEIIVLTGSGLGPEQEVDAQFTPAGTLATSLAGTSVNFDSVPAPLLSVQSEKVVCIVPFVLRAPPSVQVTANGASSNSILLRSLDTAVEILSVVNADGGLNTADHPAAVGTTVTVFAAGFGDTNPPSMDGQINGSGTLLISPVVHIARQDAQIVYAGPAPGQVAGMSNISFIVPPLRAGHYTMYVGSGPFYSYSDFNSTIINVGPQ